MTNSIESSSQSIGIEYHIQTTLPHLQTQNTIAVIKEIEKKNTPKNINEFLEIWTSLVGSKMKYDVMNYALVKEFPLDSKQGGWIDTLDHTTLSMSYEQRSLIAKTLKEYQDKLPEKEEQEYTDINLILLSLKNGNFIEFTKLVISRPSLQNTLLSDNSFAKSWMHLYKKRTVAELFQMGVGNCKTLAIMTKIMLEVGNSRWTLGIRKIDIIERDDQHIILNIYTKEGVIIYDPTAILYRK